MAAETYLPNWSVRCLSVPGPDTDLSLFVSFDNARFLFGAGEGTQRAFVQKRLGMRGMAAVFLPSGQPQGRNGLPGVIMTAADMGIRKLAVVGPPDTAHYISSFRSSVIRDQTSIDVHAFPLHSTADSEEIYKSPSMTVRAVALRPSLSTTDVSTIPPPGSPLPPRPSLYSPFQLRTWCEQIVRDMFRSGEAPLPRPSSPAPPIKSSDANDAAPHSHPSSHPHFLPRPSAPDDRFPLPLPTEADLLTEMVYICQAPDIRGKFDVAKAAALSVPNGPIRSKLVKGEAIEVADSQAPGGVRVVRPEDCLVGGGPGAVLIVVNCSFHNLEAFLSSSAFDKYQHNAMPVHCVVHRVPQSVWQDPRYQAWMAKFPETQHLIADPQGSEHMFFNSSAWNMLQQSLLDSTIFPVPAYEVGPTPRPLLPPKTELLVPNHFVRMHPAKPLERLDNHEKDRLFPTTPAELEVACEAVRAQAPEYAVAVDAARRAVAEEEAKRVGRQAVVGDDIVVTTLGTGSAIPSKYRNVSSTYIDVPNLGGILLDAGEGTLGQLRRRFGTQTKEAMERLRLIFVSHMHADHHLGLAAILQERFRLGITSKLYLIAPHAIALQLQESRAWQDGVDLSALGNVEYINIVRLKHGYASSAARVPGEKSEEKGMDVDEKVASGSTRSPRAGGGSPSNWLVEQTADEDVRAGRRKWPLENVYRFSPTVNRRQEASIFRMLHDLDLVKIHAPNVEHRGPAFGLVLTHASGWRIVYSGDTKPCRDLIEAGKKATLLIHEATLEDDKPETAAAKGHSTFSQAIDVGKRMQASHILLNHFSQRYPKIPKLPLPTTGDPNAPAVSISFDLMSVRIGDMWKVAHYMDALALLYPEEPEDGDSVAGDGEAVDGAGGVGGAGGTGTGAGGKGKGGKKEKVQQQQQNGGKKSNAAGQQNGTNGGDGAEPKPMSARAQRKLAKRLAEASSITGSVDTGVNAGVTVNTVNAHGKRASESSVEDEVVKRTREDAGVRSVL